MNGLQREKNSGRTDNSSRIAVVVVDPQNDFCNAEGVVARLAENPEALAAAVSWINNFLAIARNALAPCFIVQSFFDEKYKLPSLASKHRRLGIRQSVCVEGSWGATIELLKVHPSDLLITKHTADAFLYTSLEPLLWKYNVKTVILCGFLTEICILETGRSALIRGFEVIVPREGTAGLSAICTEGALEELRVRQAQIVRGDDLLLNRTLDDSESTQILFDLK